MAMSAEDYFKSKGIDPSVELKDFDVQKALAFLDKVKEVLEDRNSAVETVHGVKLVVFTAFKVITGLDIKI
jgi:hypothetical protein